MILARKDELLWHTIILKTTFVSITMALAPLLRILPVIWEKLWQAKIAGYGA